MEFNNNNNFNNYGNNSFPGGNFNSYNNNFQPNRENDVNWKLVIEIVGFLVIVAAIWFLFNKSENMDNDKKNEIVSQAVEVNLLETSANIYVGDTKKINYEVINANINNPIIFNSNNFDIATVDSSGNIRGISVGTTTITISYNGKNGNESKVYNVTVIPKATPQPITPTLTPTPTPKPVDCDKITSMQRNSKCIIPYGIKCMVVVDGHDTTWHSSNNSQVQALLSCGSQGRCQIKCVKNN